MTNIKNNESKTHKEYYLKSGNWLTTKIPSTTNKKIILFLPEIALAINTIISQTQTKLLKSDQWNLKNIEILLAPFANGSGSKIVMKIILSEELKKIIKLVHFYALTFEVYINGNKTKNHTEFRIWYKVGKNVTQAQMIKIAETKNFQFKISYYPENRTIWMGALIRYFFN